MLRPLAGIEKAFAHPLFPEWMNLAIKFTDPKYVGKTLSNFRKIFVGLRTKVEDEKYIRTTDATVQKLPNYIQDCRTACEWIAKNHMPKITERLATIAANDHIIVVNSSHALSDSGFLIDAINHALDDNIKEPDFPIPTHDAFKPELEQAERVKPKLYPYNQCSHYIINMSDPHLAPKHIKPFPMDDRIPAEKLQCYVSKAKRPKSLTEALSTAISLTLNAYGNRPDAPLALPIIFDLRRFIDPSRVGWNFGNCVSGPSIYAMQKENSTISDIYKMFRKSLTGLMNDGIFYGVEHYPYISDPYKMHSILSNLGPVKFKHPIVDLEIMSIPDLDDSFGIDPSQAGASIGFFSYSKVSPNKNIICNTFRFQPNIMTRETAEVFKQSIHYFLTQIPADTKYKEAYNAMKNFQEKVVKEF
ncbi:hypothetical protein GPJ56_007849 [Histomonas meleagridis]|uniref:uncharacterized protein n=1 Tax=Histomonas meleagridis TaxID=135588 RepID=UPI0035594EBB|nr:hypothetical protein GPJ56_007849 [Histomonas meleagridis]KAH0804069.1 hypothetical protein GO595_002899 [Histomonas meleagridis]